MFSLYICLLLKETLINKLIQEWVKNGKNLDIQFSRETISQTLLDMVFIIFFIVSLICLLLLILSLWSRMRLVKLQ
ncbi:hypothetical protein GH733_014503, partial [Mirounga leonina]